MRIACGLCWPCVAARSFCRVWSVVGGYLLCSSCGSPSTFHHLLSDAVVHACVCQVDCSDSWCCQRRGRRRCRCRRRLFSFGCGFVVCFLAAVAAACRLLLLPSLMFDVAVLLLLLFVVLPRSWLSSLLLLLQVCCLDLISGTSEVFWQSICQQPH